MGSPVEVAFLRVAHEELQEMQELQELQGMQEISLQGLQGKPLCVALWVPFKISVITRE